MAANVSKLRHLFVKIGQQLLVLIVGLLIFAAIPLQIGLAVPFIILRTFVRLIARILRPDLEEIFSGIGVFVALESVYSRPKNVILLSCVFDGRFTVSQLQSEFQRRVLNFSDPKGNLPYAHFRQHWTQFLGYFFWQWDTNFSLKNHIRTYDYTEPELALPEVCTEDDLKRVIGRLVGQPFRQGQSPWEALLIPKYRSAENCSTGSEKSQAVVVCRVHHALGDGYSLLKVLLKWMGAESGMETVPKPSFPKLSASQQFLGAIFQPLRLPFDLASQLCAAYDGSNSWHLVGKKLSRSYLTFYSDPVPVQTIKYIKNHHEVSYNAAIYAIVLGAIRRMMLEVGQEVPEKIACFVPFPLPRHPGGLVMHVSGIHFKFFPRLHSPPERLHQVSKGFRIIQSTPWLPAVLSAIMNGLAILPVWMLKLIYNRSMVTLGMTSFPGPEQHLHAMGTAKLVEIIPALGHVSGNTGAAAVLVSLAGKQRIVLTVDQDIFRGYKIPQNFATHINDEVEALLLSHQESRIEQV